MAIAFDRAPKSIPAPYGGIVFRSRAEARWALFFDTLGVPWQYEAEGYQLPSGWYLPDFLLPRADCWVEVKGAAPTEREKRLSRELCARTARRVILVYGPFGYWLPEFGSFRPTAAYCLSPSMDPDGEVVCFGEDVEYEPCVCPVCGEFGFEFQGRGARICKGKRNCCGDDDRGCEVDFGRVREATDLVVARKFWK